MSFVGSFYTVYNLIGYEPGNDLFYISPSAGNGVFHVVNSIILQCRDFASTFNKCVITCTIKFGSLSIYKTY